MKKLLCLLLVLVSVLFCSCGALGKTPATLAENIDLGDDGIISASVFEELQKQNKVCTFIGKSGDIQYRWHVFGRDIENAKELCLGVEVIESDEEKVILRFLSEESFGFYPTLSVYLNDIWSAQSAKALTDTGKSYPVSVTGKEQSILTFTPDIQTGCCTITPIFEDNSEAETSAVSEEALPKEETTAETAEANNAPDPSASDSSVSAALTEVTTAAEKAEPSAPNGNNVIHSSESIAFEGETSAPVSSGTPPAVTAPVEVTSPVSTDAPNTKRPVSDGSSTGQDEYKTDPVPEGKPLPVEPDDEKVDDEVSFTCIFSIECSTILNNIQDLEKDKLDVLPSDGIIFAAQAVTFYDGESVYDVLERVCRENNIHMEASFTPMYNSAYVEGIGNLYEFDCGSGSGWMYRVDGWYPNYGCSRYQLADGEVVEWRYTCDLGSDIGGGYAIGG